MASIRCRGPRKYQARIVRKGHAPLAKTFTSREAAQVWANQTEGKLEEGTLLDTPRRARMTLADALTRYEAEVTPAKRGAVAEKGRIRLWRNHPLVYRFLDAIRGSDVARHLDARLRDGRSGNTVRLELALLSHVYEVARREWGWENLANPVKAVRRPKLAKGRERRLLAGEEKALIKYCDGVGHYHLKAAIVLALETGMRRSELNKLRWCDVDLKARTAYLSQTKNGDSRTVPLSTAAIAALSGLPRNLDGNVFSVGSDWISHSFIRACKECGMVGLRLHDLRHEATSRLFEKGLNVVEVATITGHKTLQMLNRYTHLKAANLVARLG